MRPARATTAAKPTPRSTSAAGSGRLLESSVSRIELVSGRVCAIVYQSFVYRIRIHCRSPAT